MSNLLLQTILNIARHSKTPHRLLSPSNLPIIERIGIGMPTKSPKSLLDLFHIDPTNAIIVKTVPMLVLEGADIAEVVAVVGGTVVDHYCVQLVDQASLF